MIQAEDGTMKVKKGPVVILHVTKLSNNLYKLKENKVVGGASVSMEAEGDELLLWHIMLDHMS